MNGGQFPLPGLGTKISRVVYEPWRWTYFHTPLHRPLGIYMHLWSSEAFDANGEPI
ncbi:MAG: hypothetical protein JWQ71_155 [Pedosphaera sp.]|nr:hypothetical protein [Pedosphaera sp.]